MNFNGGKGTATIIGVLLAIDWRVGLIGFALFVVVALCNRLSRVRCADALLDAHRDGSLGRRILADCDSNTIIWNCNLEAY